MIDHIGIDVSVLEDSRRFYAQVLATIGYTLVQASPHRVGFGVGRMPYFTIRTATVPHPAPVHVAFVAADRAAVDAFYAAALSAGVRDHGPPALRPQYHANYYGAFVLDPDGHNIEAVCHQPG